MKWTFYLFSTFSLFFFCTASRRIYRGANAPHGLAPFYAAILYPNSLIINCGGAIISAKAIVTAAHCFYPQEFKHGLYLKIGTDNLREGGSDYDIDAVHVHSKYSMNTSVNDIAIVKPKNQIVFNRKTAQIPLINHVLHDDDGPLILTGFGQLEDESFPMELQRSVDQYVVGLKECEAEWHPVPVGESQICAKSIIGSGCHGDSGGPLVYHNQLVGVVSGGDIDCSNKHPAYYTSVYYFRNWIKKIRDLIENS